MSEDHDDHTVGEHAVPHDDHADHAATDDELTYDSVASWEARYAESDHIWSGNANAALVSVLGGLGNLTTSSPLTSLDIGCGEGADAIWLAEHGWHATGIDVSPTAISRAEAAARARDTTVDFAAADVRQWVGPDGGYDLVTGCFLHTRMPETREDLLAAVAAQVKPGGLLFLLSHAAMPPWAKDHDHGAHEDGGHDHSHDPVTPESDLAILEALTTADGTPIRWIHVLADVRTRQATGPDGQVAELEDSIVLVRRR